MSSETDSQGGPSKREKLRQIYREINDATSPGDVVFFVSKRPEDRSLSMLKRLYRRWQGFSDEDNTNWHTSMYTMERKQSRGATVRPYVIHATSGNGVEEIFIPPAFFVSERSEEGDVTQHGRLEIIKSPDLSPRERDELVQFTREQLGKPFADLNWRNDILTYALGVPAKTLDPAKASCHGLIFDAYEHIGFSFAHRLEHSPWFSAGRHLGHPIGEDPARANLQRLYLHDHHLYQDPRFICVLSVYEDPDSGEVRTDRNPGKYSWNPALQQKYGVK